MQETGRIESVEVKTVWDGETAFTIWLATNPDYLSQATGLRMPDELHPERPTANFRVDLVGQDEDGNYVVIENQFGDSNHEHLGKLITYAAASKAKTAIWIVERAKAEHVDAINILNQVPSVSFYMLSLEVVRIDDSRPAPKLTLIVGPSDDARNISETRQETKIETEQNDKKKREFWGRLVQEIRKRKLLLHAGATDTKNSFLGTTNNLKGLMLSYVIGMTDSRVELYIASPNNTEEENLKVFNHFLENKEAIESAFGGGLEWQSLPGKRAKRIAKRLATRGLSDRKAWDETQSTMIEAMGRLYKALKPHIESLNV